MILMVEPEMLKEESRPDYDPGCSLCQLMKDSKKIWKIIICDNCKVPMLVVKPHGKISGGLENQMLSLMVSYYPEAKITGMIPEERHAVKSHFHLHAR